MENSEINKSLDVILEKRRNCIPLTNEEEKLANESLTKLLDAKKCVNKTVTSTTGDEIRKSAASPVLPKAPSTDKATEGVPPKDRAKEGGYDSKADVSERTEVTPGSVQPEAATREDSHPDQKEEKVPSEKTAGKPYGDKTKEEWADVDNKEFKQENYQEDRLGRMTEHANYKDSIKTQSIVVKTMANGNKLVGQVLKVYSIKNGQTGLMVKWSDGRFEHVNQESVELLKSEKTEKGIGEFVADVAANMVGSTLTELLPKPKKIKLPKMAAAGPEASGNIVTNKAVDESSTEKVTKVEGAIAPDEVAAPEATPEADTTAADEPLPEAAPEEFIRGVVDSLKELTDLSEEEIIKVAQTAWQEIVAEESAKVPTEEKVMENNDIQKPEVKE